MLQDRLLSASLVDLNVCSGLLATLATTPDLSPSMSSTSVRSFVQDIRSNEWCKSVSSEAAYTAYLRLILQPGDILPLGIPEASSISASSAGVHAFIRHDRPFSAR